MAAAFFYSIGKSEMETFLTFFGVAIIILLWIAIIALLVGGWFIILFVAFIAINAFKDDDQKINERMPIIIASGAVGFIIFILLWIWTLTW